MQSKSSFINRSDLFLIGWVVYYLQGILYEEGGLVSTALLGLLLLVSLLYFFKTIQLSLPVYFKGLNILLLMFTIYGAFHIISNPGTIHYRASGFTLESYEYLKEIWLSLLPIYPFYYFSRKGYINEDKMKIWFYVFLISCTLTFFRSQRDAILVRGVEEVTNNSGYLLLSLLPGLVLFQRKTIMQFVLMTFIMALIFIGMKRGAILIALITLPMLLWRSFTMATKKQKYVFIVLVASFIYLGVSFIKYQMQTSEYLMLRILETEAGESSGRDSLYGFFIHYFFNQDSFFAFLFGNGANATINIFENYAHNDWLEIAINQGLVGVVIYVIYWISFFYTWKKSSNYSIKLGLAIMFVVLLTKTFFSMSYGNMSYVSTCILGFFLAHFRDDVKCSRL